jgi:restriction endonuclease S subunit
LEKRLDPLYYASNIFGFLKTTDYQVKSIREVIDYSVSGFGVGREEQDLTEKGYVQIRPTNLDEYGNLKFDRNIYLGNEYLEKKKSNVIQKNDILFNNTNSQELVGKTAFFDLDGTYFHSNHITRIRVNESILRPKFLWILFNLYQERKIFYTLCTNWNNQSGIGIELLNSIRIIIPPFEIQDKVISIKEKSIQQKKQNEAEAEKLLASIDDYLLKELGITLPTPPENTLKNRMFKTTLKEISGGRFDSNYYQDYHKNNFIAFEKSTYKINTLHEITENIFQGVGRNIDEKSNFILLKVKNIKQNYEIDYEDTEKIGDFPFSKLLRQGDIITPCIGEAVRQIKFAVFEKENDKYLVDNNTGVIRLSKNVNSYFANYCLCSSIGKLQINRFIGGGGVPFLGADNLKRFIIPVPPLDKQKEIANQIKGIRHQAQQLKEKTKEALSKASQEIEKILLA